MVIAENVYTIRYMPRLYEVEVELVCEAEHGQAHEVLDREVN